MQYHDHGFRPGDPELSAPAPGRPHPAELPECVDVLVVGCGPAGLTLAAYLAGFPEISTRIVERRAGPMEKGQADGISCRSMEMFNAFGFADTVKRQGYQVNETVFWKADAEKPDHIVRTGRVDDVEEGISEMPHMILNQARVHDMYLTVMEKSASRLMPDYGLELVDVTVDSADQDYPATVTLKHADEQPVGAKNDALASAREETITIRAKYVVGCDGARSQVRHAMGLELKGDSANQVWGVMDVLAVTDFPDIRCKTLIQASGGGNIIIIPREGGYLLRFYVELGSLKAGERLARDEVTVDRLINAVQRTFRPYNFSVKEVAWWSVYEIGQRLTDKFDDTDDSSSGSPRIFIAGDACHTHSPKAGQGMNVSMGDAFNLAWKVVSVLTGRSDESLLKTYSEERQGVAQALIDFDREWSRIISERADAEPAGAQETPRFQRYFIEHGRTTAGLSVIYEPSRLTGKKTWQSLAAGFSIGERFHSAPVVRLADAKPMQLGETVGTDARWKLYAFAPAADLTSEASAIGELCDYLGSDPQSPIRRHTRPGEDIDAVIDVRAVFQQATRNLDLAAMPLFLKPKKGPLGLIDYEKIFCSDQRSGKDIFDLRNVDRQQGCLVLVRPDQHVAHVLPLDARDELSAFFAGILLPAHGDEGEPAVRAMATGT
ncbi:FAD-dependent monooxygenase [Notoacmeibacter sp. MSK16QG-6]|uniref:FAD-dependent monooxygenase n=1 Tax=Notoacmeibacter sp. MSK16QG-6 TaxID=2957982 RepID=UPI0020A10AD7|nr:FAD-dependent monooxygenase [Notoacmeibacter sp. MSK16QG-6]MCP1200553.1 FAD-dependent monooxygenase [Notoacmeibacter sp. MSK16QG-6]